MVVHRLVLIARLFLLLASFILGCYLFSARGLSSYLSISQELAHVNQINTGLEDVHQVLQQRIEQLRDHDAVIINQAREELGFIAKGETFYLFRV